MGKTIQTLVMLACWILLPAFTTGIAVQLKTSPLIGGPSFLQVHVKVVVAEDHVFDFIPLNAEDPTTLKDLIRLRGVPGQIRYLGKKTTPSPLVEKAVAFVENYSNTDLHLIKNNCWTFAVRMLWDLKGEEDQAFTQP